MGGKKRKGFYLHENEIIFCIVAQFSSILHEINIFLELFFMTLIDCFRAVYKTLSFRTFINVSPFGFHGETPPGSPHTVVVVQLPSRVQLFVTPWTATLQEPPSFTISQSLLKLKSIESTIPSNHLIICHPLLLLPSIFPSIRVFSNESALCIRWPKYWSFSFSFSPSKEYSGLISFGIDRFDLLAVQGTLKSLQHHSSKFFGTQLSLWSNSHIRT